MPPIQLLIKPSSGRCNLRCKYCFYEDIMDKRDTKCLDFMSFETLEIIIKRAMQYADKFCSFAFQGGEPTLVGLDFFQKVIHLQKKYQKEGVLIENVIQTNGYKLTSEWVEFFLQNNFLVGLSLDGIKRTHDIYRTNAAGVGSFDEIMKSVALFKKYNMTFNILTVVNNMTASNIKKIYAFYKKNSFQYQQYIPCLEPLLEKRGEKEYSLLPETYSRFLITLFQLWYQDLLIGEQPYIRQFENYIAILLGEMPESCELKEKCGIQNVIESDGSVYPCDFYVLDQFCLGNLHNESLDEITKKKRAIDFIEESRIDLEECIECEYYTLCHGGCARQREENEIHGRGKNYFCESYKEFFKETLPKLQYIAEEIRRYRNL